MIKQSVYLAGSLSNPWRQEVMNKAPNFIYFNPAVKEENQTLILGEYLTWDLHYIKQCDIIFAYVHIENLSCIGVACEVGYAKGLGKTVISVVEPKHLTIKDNYLSFISGVADINFQTLSKGIDYLNLYSLSTTRP